VIHWSCEFKTGTYIYLQKCVGWIWEDAIWHLKDWNNLLFITNYFPVKHPLDASCGSIWHINWSVFSFHHCKCAQTTNMSEIDMLIRWAALLDNWYIREYKLSLVSLVVSFDFVDAGSVPNGVRFQITTSATNSLISGWHQWHVIGWWQTLQPLNLPRERIQCVCVCVCLSDQKLWCYLKALSGRTIKFSSQFHVFIT